MFCRPHHAVMSWAHAVAKLYFNCGQFGAALSDGAFVVTISFYFTNHFSLSILVLSFYWHRFFFIFIFYQCDKTFSVEESCQRLLCCTCAQYHENHFKQDVYRARNLDNIISTGTFVCTFEECAQDIPAPQYSDHQRMCPYKRLACPICNQGFASILLRSHLLRQHQFNHYQLNYGCLNTGLTISNDRGCVFSGREEDFVFFIAGATFYFVWLGASAALRLNCLLLHQCKYLIDGVSGRSSDPAGFWVVHRFTATEVYWCCSSH